MERNTDKQTEGIFHIELAGILYYTKPGREKGKEEEEAPFLNSAAGSADLHV